MDKKQEAIILLSQNLGISKNNFNSKEKAFKQLSNYLNDLIINDFNKLLRILYRIDISEEKLILTLANNQNKNSGEVISNLLIEREMEKFKFREWYKYR